MAGDEGRHLEQDEMDDLGELGNEEGGGDDPDDLDDAGEDELGDQDDDLPTPEQWKKIQDKVKRQEDRITRLTGKDRRGRSVDQKLKDQLNGGKGRSTKSADADDADDEANSEAARWRTIAAQQSAATQLTAAGFNGTAKQAARLTRLLDLAGAEPDDSGAFDFEDEIEDLQEEYPELFGAKGSRRNERQERSNGTRQRTAPTRDSREKLDPTQSTSRKLLRGAGFQV